MINFKKISASPVFLVIGVWLSAAQLEAAPLPMELAYTNPAVAWNQALPIGNGKLAAMVFGGAASEHIQFNEDTLWAGQPHDYSHPGASNYLASIRQMIWDGQGGEMYKAIAKEHFMSVPLRQCGYQPCGDLLLNFPQTNAVNYRRTLDLNTATASVQYEENGVTYRREVFASYPDHVIVMRLTASAPGHLSFSYGLDSAHVNHTIVNNGTDLLMTGKITATTFGNNLPSVLRFAAQVRIQTEGGSVVATNGMVQVTGADSATLILTAASSFVNYHDVSGDPVQRCHDFMTAANAHEYPALRQRHLADYQSLFQRVTVDFGTSAKAALPTDQRLAHLPAGNDPQLSALFFQMGRYLMIAGSRPGSQPLNLQGKWNNRTDPPWESKWTVNINTEMNYWCAEECNLGECHLPLFDLIHDLAETGRVTARTHYNADGWVVHHNTDLWRGTAPINGADGIWPMGGAWLCQHLWWHYQFGGDTNFLAQTAYPIMKEAARFYVDFLIPDPRRSDTNAYLMTNPSFSPEHGVDCAAPTMDNQLLRSLFGSVIQAGQILGVDADFCAQIARIRNRLPPNQIGHFGQLQEWFEDLDSPTEQHRHCSNMWGLYPGDEITLDGTPAFAAAAEKSLNIRGDSFNNNGWSKAWKMCLRDRLREGDHAYLILTNLMSRDLQTDLLFMRSNTQIDGTFGACAGIGEMLLQSQAGEIALLPALPSAWPNGRVTGLCARGGFEVDLQWQNGRLTHAVLHSKLGQPCRLRAGGPVEIWHGAERVASQSAPDQSCQFSTIAGESYEIKGI